MALDELMHNRASLNSAICLGMAGLEESWGIKVTRYEVGASNEYPRGYRFQILKVTLYEVQNIEVDKSTEDSMAKQSAAERNRRVSAARAQSTSASLLLIQPSSPPHPGHGSH